MSKAEFLIYMWIDMYMWLYTFVHIHLMKPWTPLWKTVHANIFSFNRLSFSILIIQVPLGMVKIWTHDFTLQLFSPSVWVQALSVIPWWCDGPIASVSLCAKIDTVSGIPQGPLEHCRQSFCERMGRPDEFKSCSCPRSPSTHPVQHSRSSHCIFYNSFSFLFLPISAVPLA